MAVAFNAQSTGSTASGTTLTFAHTPAGSNRLLVVQATSNSSSVTFTATFNGVSMTQITTQSNLIRQTVFYLFAPTASAQNVVITASSSTGIKGIAVSYTGCLQTSSVIDGFSSGNNDGMGNLSVSITTANTGTWGVSCLGTDSSSTASVTSQTSRASLGTNSPGMSNYDTNASLTPGSNTATSPGNGGFFSIYLIYFGIREASATPAPTTGFLMQYITSQ